MLSIKIKGLNRTRRLFKKIAEKAPIAAIEIVKIGSKRMKTYAQSKVPIRSGKLKKSIRKKLVANRKLPYANVECGEGLAYAHSIESGSVPHYIWTNPIWAHIHKTQNRMHPGTRPTWFWRNSINKVTQEFPDIIKEGWNKHFTGGLRI